MPTQENGMADERTDKENQVYPSLYESVGVILTMSFLQGTQVYRLMAVKRLYYEKKIKTMPSISYMHSRIKSKYVYVYLYIYVQ